MLDLSLIPVQLKLPAMHDLCLLGNYLTTGPADIEEKTDW